MSSNSSNKPEKFKITVNNKNIMEKGVLLVEFFQPRNMINAKVYCETCGEPFKTKEE